MGVITLFIIIVVVAVTAVCCWCDNRKRKILFSVSGDSQASCGSASPSVSVASNVAYKKHKADSDLSFLVPEKDSTEFDMSKNIAYKNRSPESLESPASSVNSSGVHYDRIRTTSTRRLDRPQAECHAFSYSSNGSKGVDYYEYIQT